MADFLNKIKSIIGIEEDYDEDYEYEEEYEDDYIDESLVKQSTIRKDRVLNIHSSSNAKVVVHEPLTFDDAPRILDDIKVRKIIIINLENLEMENKRQIFDFVNGGVYSLEGIIQKVTTDIFIIAPNNVEIDGNIKDQIKNKGIFQW